MASLKALRKNYQVEAETAAKTAKTANFDKSLAKLTNIAL